MAKENAPSPLGTIQLGDFACDVITGFEGVVIAETNWLHGCRRLTIQPQGLDKDGAIKTAHTVDEPACRLVKAAKPKAAKVTTGGPRPEPTRGR